MDTLRDEFNAFKEKQEALNESYGERIRSLEALNQRTIAQVISTLKINIPLFLN